jgi:hypothetical protein
LCIKAGAFAIVEGLNLPLCRRQHYVKACKGRVGYVSPHGIHPLAVGGPTPVQFVIFARYADGGKPRMHSLSRSHAAFALCRYALNRNAFGDRTIEVVSSLVRDVECLGLEAGSLDETCDLVDSLA